MRDVDRRRPRRGADQRNLDRETLVLERARGATGTNPMVASQRIGAARRQNQFGAGLDLRAGEQRKFDVVADIDAEAAQLGFKQFQRRAATDVPFLSFETRHYALVLMLHAAVRREHPGAIDVDAGVHFPGIAAGDDVDAVALCEALMQRDVIVAIALDLADLPEHVGLHRLRQQSGQYHRRILREHQQACVLTHRLGHPVGDSLFKLRPVLRLERRKLGSGQHEGIAHQASRFLSQKLTGFSVDCSCPRSGQANEVRRSGRGW